MCRHYHTPGPEMLEWLRTNSRDFTIQELADRFDYNYHQMHSLLSRYLLPAKKAKRIGKAKNERPVCDPQGKKYQRPAPVYSNTSPYGIASAFLNGLTI